MTRFVLSSLSSKCHLSVLVILLYQLYDVAFGKLLGEGEGVCGKTKNL